MLADEILDNYTVIDSDTVNEAIYKIKDKLLSSIGPTAYDYSFYVVKRSRSMPLQRWVVIFFIFSGMIEIAEEPEELAAVLAHEIGHVEERHVVNKLVKEIGVTVLFSILSGGDPVLISEIARATVSSAFDRSQESEADLFAINTLKKANISPRYVASIFRRIKRNMGGMMSVLNSLCHTQISTNESKNPWNIQSKRTLSRLPSRLTGLR